MAQHEIDVGDNLEGLGFAYLFFRFVWPVIIGAIVLIVMGVIVYRFLMFAAANPLNFLPPMLPQAPQVWLSGLFK